LSVDVRMQVAMVFTYSQKPVWLALAAAWLC